VKKKLFTRTEPSVSSTAWATADGGGVLVAVHVPAVNGSWAPAMPDQTSVISKAIPRVRKTFIGDLVFRVVQNVVVEANFRLIYLPHTSETVP
jgi:hypothetical protein